MRAVVLLLAASLAACSTVDRQHGTSFEPLGGGEFRYVAIADLIYPLDSPGGERERRDWLEQYLRDNSLCARGYEITERKPVVQTSSSLTGAKTYRVFYRGRCKS